MCSSTEKYMGLSPCSSHFKDRNKNLDFEYSVSVNISYSGGQRFKTEIQSDYDFVSEYLKLKQYYIDSNTRKVLIEKNKIK